MNNFLSYQGRTSESLRKAVIAGLGDIETLSDVSQYGADGGYGDFCYHSDTIAFYRKNKKAIMNMAKQDADNFGMSISKMLAGFKCLKDISESEIELVLMNMHDDDHTATQVYNALTWYALESVAHDYVLKIMRSNMYIITDWAGNVLDFKGRFKLPQLAVPIEFDSFDDAEEWLCINLKDYDEERQDIYIEESK